MKIDIPNVSDQPKKTLFHFKVQTILTTLQRGLLWWQSTHRIKEGKSICLHTCQMAKQDFYSFNYSVAETLPQIPSSPFSDMRYKVSVSPFWDKLHPFLLIAISFGNWKCVGLFLQQTRRSRDNSREVFGVPNCRAHADTSNIRILSGLN